MHWEVHVTGPEAVLQELAHAFHNGEPSLTRQGNEWFLRSQTFDGLLDASAVRDQAERIIEVLSGISRLLLHGESPLKVSHISQVKPDGTRNIYVQLEPAVMRISAGLASVVVTHTDGTVEEHRPSDPAPRWLAKAVSDPAAARALRLRNAENLTWTDLYRLYEVIEAGAGGEPAILAAGWTTRSQLRCFTHSANSVTVAGDDARHGVEETLPPAKGMTLAETRSFIDGLLGHWLSAV